ncbi:MAG: M66 family metalloprotease [Planctomycetota bacterium]
MLTKQLGGFLTLALLLIPCSAVSAADSTLVFNTIAPTNDLQGNLAAQVLFAQSQIIPARPRSGDHQPHLIGRRKCLFLVRPLQADDITPWQVAALDKNGQRLGTFRLDPPAKLPKTAYYLDGLPEEKIEFKPAEGPVKTISGKGDLDKLPDPRAAFLSDQLRLSALVEIQTADGLWVRDIHLPKHADFEGKMVRVRSTAGYSSTVHYSQRSAAINRNQTLQFKFVSGQWVLEGELENQSLTYAADAWSGTLPAEWMVPGLKLLFRQGERNGELKDLQIGAPTELLLHTIDLGMLVPPRDRFEFARDVTAHREYFQTVPTSRLVVSNYAPLYLREVMLPTGTLLVELDPSKGDWHNGTMRQQIGKELISHGIDNANYGIPSSAGVGEDSHPYVAAQLAAHNSSGKYSNGIVTHGGSGGGGIVTLDATLGNEFSHEVGHNYGLGHYVGGFQGSVHRSADQNNSTWGWDADQNRFLPNFSPIRSGKETCLENQCQSPFHGRSFGLDAMAGGAPLSGFNRFTLYTPNSAAIIQKFFESKAVFDADSPTGFRKWNERTSQMEPYTHRIEIAEQIAAPLSDVGVEKMAQLLAEYELVRVSMQDGNWTKEVQLPAASPANRGRCVTIHQAATYDSFLLINGQQVKMPRGFKGSYTSDGKRWNEGQAESQWVERKPQAFGVPVTTLVGYYDPRGELHGYIYPPLHGAYGFTYADDRERVTEQDCQLVVETRTGTLRFRLAKHRLQAKVMNKFHVNVPESSEPQSVSLVVGGKVVDKKTISAPAEKLVYTTHPAE